MVEIVGSYKLASSDNFEEYMKELGVGFALRKIANSSTPVVEFSRTGDDFTIKTKTTLKTYHQSFTLGVKADSRSLDDLAVKSLVTLEGDSVLKEIQERPDKTTEIIREFSETDMKVTFKIGDVTAVRVYKRV